MSTTNYANQTLGNIVADDFRTASVLMNAGIDFCCGGKMTLGKACEGKNINVAEIEAKIEGVKTSPINPGQDYKQWPLDFLADYIVNTHHKYVLKTLPELMFYTGKIAKVHHHHAELQEVASLFSQINDELIQHLKNEEEVLFPAIKRMLKSKNDSDKALILSEITRMGGEHEFAGGAMDKINEITGGYTLPGDACSTYEVTFAMLKQFEDDLHIHVHLENNILFPKALEL